MTMTKKEILGGKHVALPLCPS